MEIISILLSTILIAVSILIVLVVLLQRPKQEGLGAAFGGSTLDSALGAHTSDVLQKITKWFGIVFFVSAIGLAIVKARQLQDSAANDVMEEVEKREPNIPDLPPSLTNLPPISSDTTPAGPTTDSSTAPAAADDKEKGNGKEEPGSKPKSDDKPTSPNQNSGKAKEEGKSDEKAK